MFSLYSFCVFNQKRIEGDLDIGSWSIEQNNGKIQKGWVQDLRLCMLQCPSLWGSLPTYQHLTHLSFSFCNFFFCSCSELQFLFWFPPPLCSSYSPDSTQLVFKTMPSISQSKDGSSLAISWLSLHPHHGPAVLSTKGKCVVDQQRACSLGVARPCRALQLKWI